MADCCLIVLWTALLSTASHWAGEAVQIKTVRAFPSECGSTHEVRNKDTFRILMPKKHTCPSHGFTCAIHFTASPKSSGNRILCVDFSRLRLVGEGSRLKISRSRRGGSLSTMKMLTKFAYPLMPNGMGSTTECILHYHPTQDLTLTFHSDCSVPNSTLRDYFVSWVYVYMQPSKDHLVYYLDGTCRHEETLSPVKRQVTVRSVLWRDTAGEPPLQNCSLHLSFFSSIEVQLCLAWRVDWQRWPCQVSAHLRQVRLSDIWDYSGSRDLTCHAGAGAHGADLRTCVDFSQTGILRKAVFTVARNEDVVGHDGEWGDRAKAVLFTMDASLTMGKNNDVKNNDELQEIKNADSDEEDLEDTSITMKVLFPLALLFSVCSCVCGVAQKRAKAQQMELRVVEGAGGSPYRSYQGSTSEPRTTPPLAQAGMVRRGPPWSTYRADSQADQRLVEPPPKYADLDLVPLTSLGGSRDAGGLGTTTVPLPPHDDDGDEASSGPWPVVVGGGDSVGPPPPPPPPISHGAPPAYHDLFPPPPTS